MAGILARVCHAVVVLCGLGLRSRLKAWLGGITAKEAPHRAGKLVLWPEVSVSLQVALSTGLLECHSMAGSLRVSIPETKEELQCLL